MKPDDHSQEENKPTVKQSALRIFWGQIRKTNRSGVDSDKTKFLKRIPFFEGLKRHQLELLTQIMYERSYNEGEFIFEIEQPGAALFIIQTGEVSVEIPNSTSGDSSQHKPTRLALLNKYAFFGEIALIDESPRSASAKAVVSTKVFTLFRKDLDLLNETNPEITAKIYKALASVIGNRLKATNELFDKKLKAVA